MGETSPSFAGMFYWYFSKMKLLQLAGACWICWILVTEAVDLPEC